MLLLLLLLGSLPCPQLAAAAELPGFASASAAAASYPSSSDDEFCHFPEGGAPAHALSDFSWLHAPKTGTSAVVLLAHYACPSLPADALPKPPPKGFSFDRKGPTILQQFWSDYPYEEFCKPRTFLPPHHGHYPMAMLKARARKASNDEAPVKNVVAMLRDPRRRIWSAYNYFKHTNGMKKSKRAEMLASVTSVKEYAAFPGVAGCQTRMLLGRRCNEATTLNAKKMNEAIRRLRTHLVFVGLTDEWNDSMCLFHRMFGGKAVAGSFKNVRDTAKILASDGKEEDREGRGEGGGGGEGGGDDAGYVRDQALEELGPEDDKWDWQLYQEAVKIFRQNQEKYGGVRAKAA